MTKAAVDANQKNATNATGPTSEAGKATTRLNAYKHSLRTKMLLLKTEAENEEFGSLVRRLEETLRPEGELERLYLDDIATYWWKVQIAEALETRELVRLQTRNSDASGILDAVLRWSSVKMPVGSPIVSINSDGWEIGQIVVKAAGHDGDASASSQHNNLKGVVKETGVPIRQLFGQDSSSSRGKELELHAVLDRSLERYARYNAAIRRSFFRSLDAFQRLQAARRDRNKG
jgi:hypothetical protein